MSKVIVMVGESGSGKSTFARQLVKDSKGGAVRLNRDELRLMLHDNEDKSRRMEKLVTAMQMNLADHALSEGLSPIIDDTNLSHMTRGKWREFAAQHNVEHEEVRMDSPLAECIDRDNRRNGKAHVGAAVIYRQFLDSGRLPIDPDKKIVLVDVDGTLAHNDGHRSFYDESKVLRDKCHWHIADWVNELAKEYTIFVVSGRHSTCGTDTINWLKMWGIHHDAVFMRHAWDNRSDEVVKKEILDSILKIVPKENIFMVIDDRPKVLRMWRANGLKVIPVAGACDEF